MTGKIEVRSSKFEISAEGGNYGFTPLDKSADFYPVRKNDNIEISNGVNRWSLLLKDDGGLTPPSQTVREQSYLTGFTFIEILIVIVLIGIAAMIAVPMMSSAASMQIRSAANMIAADLEYAKSMAITRGQYFSVVFEKENEIYSIKQEGSTEPIWHPVKKGFQYVINFKNESRLGQVVIVDAVFNPNSSQTITFDYLGSPYSGTGISNPLNSGSVSMQAGDFSKTVHVEPVTGYITITD